MRKIISLLTLVVLMAVALGTVFAQDVPFARQMRNGHI